MEYFNMVARIMEAGGEKDEKRIIGILTNFLKRFQKNTTKRISHGGGTFPFVAGTIFFFTLLISIFLEKFFCLHLFHLSNHKLNSNRGWNLRKGILLLSLHLYYIGRQEQNPTSKIKDMIYFRAKKREFLDLFVIINHLSYL